MQPRGRPHPDGQPLVRLGVLPMADDHLAGFAQPRADIAELAVAVGGLVEVHEIHVDRGPGQVAVELRMEMGHRLIERRRPAIHILAGEKVCIQQISPTQFGAALASRQTCRIDSGVVTTGLNTTRTGSPAEALSSSTTRRLLAATCSRTCGPYRFWLPVTNHASNDFSSIMVIPFLGLAPKV